MKKKISIIMTLALLIVMTISMNSFASSGSGQVRVGMNSVYVTGASGVSRTRNYSYVSVKANSVYPTGTYSQDNFTKCKTRLYKNDSTSTSISNAVTLTEGSSYIPVTIKEGYLSLSKINICFAGNDPSYGAVIDFSYNGN